MESIIPPAQADLEAEHESTECYKQNKRTATDEYKKFLKGGKSTAFCMPYMGGEINWYPILATVCDKLLREYEEVGVRGFNFNVFAPYNDERNQDEDFDADPAGGSSNPNDRHILKLLLHLWPGDINNQILIMNRFIRESWDVKKDGARKKKKKIKQVPKNEFLQFLGVFLAASLHGKKQL